MANDRFVLDASALLALIFEEPGAARVAEALPHSVISAANLAEVVSRLIDRQYSAEECRETLALLRLDVRPFDSGAALSTGLMRQSTRHLGLSLGDRACLALAAHLGATAITADRAWAALPTPAIEVIR